MKVSNAFTAFAMTLAWGCGTFVEQTPLNAAPHPLTARPASAVELFASSPPTRAHVDVALIKADQNSDQGLAVMIAKIRETAGHMGCDAIFISGAAERAGTVPGGGLPQIDPGSHLLFATCIVYTEPSATVTSASAAAPAAQPLIKVTQ